MIRDLVDIVVRVATGYMLDGPWFEPHWGQEIFSMSLQNSLKWVPGLFSERKAAGRDVGHSCPSSVEVKGWSRASTPPLYPHCLVNGKIFRSCLFIDV